MDFHNIDWKELGAIVAVVGGAGALVRWAWGGVKAMTSAITDRFTASANNWISRLTESQRLASEQMTAQLGELTANVGKLGKTVEHLGSEFKDLRDKVFELRESDRQHGAQISELNDAVKKATCSKCGEDCVIDGAND